MTITPYINLNGNAEEALEFYHSVFGGSVDIQRWSEMPPDETMPLPDDWKNKIMHATLSIQAGLTLFISDSWAENKVPEASNVFLHVEFDSEEDAKNAFQELSQGGFINMPMADTFWGSLYGDLIDKFGIGWGLSYTQT